MKGNVYLVVHDLTFYFNHNDTVISERVINLLYQHADYVYVENEYGVIGNFSKIVHLA